MKTLNLGIVAHVDAGKTSLTERLLFAAGVIDTLGRVDDGNTQTDTLELERRRGITIKSAVTSFRIDDVTVNLLDTPGHPDFVAEVERVLGILDGAVLVVSAVEGVQAHTRVLMRTLRRLGVPTVIFVNKIDRRGARDHDLLDDLREKLDLDVVALNRVHGLGDRSAGTTMITNDDTDAASTDGTRTDGSWVDGTGAVDVLSEHSDRFLGAYLAADGRPSSASVTRELRRQSRAGVIHPVIFGSAITGAGTADLLSQLTRLLPTESGDPDGELDAAVFKIIRDDADRRIAYVRIFGGALEVRQEVASSTGPAVKITGLSVFDEGVLQPVRRAGAGQIAVVNGLTTAVIGDRLGRGATRDATAFAPPNLETVVTPKHARERGRLYAALTDLADQDPLIGLHRDALTGDATLTLYGEVQKEVLADTLAAEYGLTVHFATSRTVCVERLLGSGAAVEHAATDGNLFLATVGLRVEPAPVGAGVTFDLEVELGAMPLAFFTATEATVREQLAQGLSGWSVPDCRVIMTHSHYYPRQSHAHARFDKSMSSTGADFRGITPLVLMAALRAAGTVVCEPVHRFSLELPSDTLATVLPVIVRLRGVPLDPQVRGPWCVLQGEIPAAEVHRARELLPGLTRGEGVLESSFDRYQPTTGAAPTRPRARPDALDRKTYLLQVLRGVSA